MQVTEYPQLLITRRLLAPFRETLKLLSNIRDELSGDCMGNPLFRRGAFVMAVSSFEVTLNDSLKYYLLWFPQKLPNDTFKYTKEVFFDNYFALLKSTIDQHVGELAYKSFKDSFNRYLHYLAIDWQDTDLIDALREIHATRNLLLHNNLVVNDQYAQSAGPRARKPKGKEIDVNNNYFDQALGHIEQTINRIVFSIETKHANNTVVSANKGLWQFMFHTPVMQYDDYWTYDTTRDRIITQKKSRNEDVLSHTESICLALWRNHFNGQGGPFLARLDMRSFDLDTRDKVLFFLSIANDFNFE